LADFDGVALRQYFLSSHYRSPMDFSREGLEEAARAADRVWETVDRARKAVKDLAKTAPDANLLKDFRQEMDDDFNTPRALALIFDEMRGLNRLLDEKKRAAVDARAAALISMCDTLGLLHDGYFDRKKQRWLRTSKLTPQAIDQAIAARDRARKEKNFHEADRIRNELLTEGVVLEDKPGGTEWKVK
jgi:cysteinyl-tRNA synthetase